MTERARAILTEAIGRPLRKVIASVHFFEGRLNSEPVHVWLSFEGLTIFRLSGATDGWGVEIDEAIPEPVDMEESGEFLLADVSNKTEFGSMVGRELNGVWLVESPVEEIVGVRFDFGLPTGPVVFNWGDELRIADDYPSEVWEEGASEAAVQPVISG